MKEPEGYILEIILPAIPIHAGEQYVNLRNIHVSFSAATKPIHRAVVPSLVAARNILTVVTDDHVVFRVIRKLWTNNAARKVLLRIVVAPMEYVVLLEQILLVAVVPDFIVLVVHLETVFLTPDSSGLWNLMCFGTKSL